MNQTIEKVVSTKKCISCGMCQSSCPTEAIEIKMTKDGFFRPWINESKCVECGKCLSVCPTQANGSDSLLGEYNDLLLAHSSNAEVRHGATSGGVVNSLLRFLLERKIVEAAIVVRCSENNNVGSESVVITKDNIDDLLTKSRDYSSRYVQIPILKRVRECIGKYKKIAVVGTPCQIRALKCGGLHKIDIFMIGIACSGGMSCKATEEYKRVQNMRISKMYYRGDGWPGKNCLLNTENKVEYNHQLSLFERMFSSQIFKNPGCRSCTDHYAEEADVSFCDFWNQEEMAREHEGNSCVIVRNDRASKIFSEMQEEKYISVVRNLTEKEVLDTQWNVLLVKKGNAKEHLRYKMFMKLCDIVFRLKIYKLFRIKTYCRFCKIYKFVCRKSDISQ